MQVVLGAHSLSRPEPSKQLYDVQEVELHPLSRPDSLEDDLLLLKVRKLGPSCSGSSLDPSSVPDSLSRTQLQIPLLSPAACCSDTPLLPPSAVPECLAGSLRAAPPLASRGQRSGTWHALRCGRLGHGEPRGAQARRPAESDNANHGPQHLQPAQAPRRGHHSEHDVC